MRKRISLKQAIDFHGHIGPYLVLGLLMGEYALKIIQATPHFGLEVKVWGAKNKPKSCLIDGLQLSTGCTYGKGNIIKYNGKVIRVSFFNCATHKSMDLVLQDEIIKKLASAIDHSSSEKIARELYRSKPECIFRETSNQRRETRK